MITSRPPGLTSRRCSAMTARVSSKCSTSPEEYTRSNVSAGREGRERASQTTLPVIPCRGRLARNSRQARPDQLSRAGGTPALPAVSSVVRTLPKSRQLRKPDGPQSGERAEKHQRPHPAKLAQVEKIFKAVLRAPNARAQAPHNERRQHG